LQLLTLRGLPLLHFTFEVAIRQDNQTKRCKSRKSCFLSIDAVSGLANGVGWQKMVTLLPNRTRHPTLLMVRVCKET